MTYYEITQKMKDLKMTTSDWSWLSKYLIETGSAPVYGELVNAYQAREDTVVNMLGFALLEARKKENEKHD